MPAVFVALRALSGRRGTSISRRGATAPNTSSSDKIESAMFVAADNLALPVAPLIVLSLVFGASLLMFAVLARRWTSHRLWVELQDWSRESGYHLARTENAQVPPPLSQLTKLNPRVRWMLSNEDTSILQ